MINDLLNKGIELYHNGALLESAQCLETCVKACQDRGDDSTAMLALSNLSEAYMRLGRYRDAEMSSFELLLIARKKDSTENVIRAVGRLAMSVLILKPHSRNDEMCGQLEELISTARQIDLIYWVVQNLETLGELAMAMGDIPKAFEYFQGALNTVMNNDVFEADLFRARIYGGIARCMSNFRRSQRAKEYANIAMITAQITKSVHAMANASLCMAEVLIEADEPSNALHHALNVKERAVCEGWKFEELVARKLLTKIFLSLGRLDEAYESALRGFSLADELNIDEDASLFSLELEKICLLLNREEEASKHAEYGKQLAQKAGYAKLSKVICEVLLEDNTISNNKTEKCVS